MSIYMYETYVVQIDKDSIKENKNTRRGYGEPYFISGPLTTNADGSQSRSVTPCYSLGGEPKFVFEYLPCIITCKKCNASFSKEELIDKEIEFLSSEGDSCIDERSCCPKCGKTCNVLFKFESLDNSGNPFLRNAVIAD